MTSYIPITDTETDPDAPVTSELLKKTWQNPVAMAEGATGAPPMKAGWYPYDMVTIGDGADGLLWDYSVDGAVSFVATPTLDVGWEYALLIDGLSVSSSCDIRIEVFTSSGSSSTTIYSNASVVYVLSGMLSICDFGQSAYSSTIKEIMLIEQFSGTLLPPETYAARKNARLPMTSFNIKVSSGKFNAGKIYLYRRGGLIT